MKTVQMSDAVWLKAKTCALARGETLTAFVDRAVNVAASVESPEGSVAAVAGPRSVEDDVASPAVQSVRRRSREGSDAPGKIQRVQGSALVVPLNTPESVRERLERVASETADPWGVSCGRVTCGHPKRAHLHKNGELGRCQHGTGCGCPDFTEEPF